MSQVRVRFAPSPTGFLHIGGVRTALFNWLFARQQNGVFILRIEDTDQDRSTDASIQAILDGMRWVKLDWDEGPFRQTERMDLYRSHALRLFEQGHAYWCVCTPEELEARRKEAEAKGGSPRYDGRCRNLGLAKPTSDAALRFKAPQDGQTVVDDLIKGRVVFDNQILDDVIILRSNGFPTYNFSVVVDDALMGITHVVRGDDHLTNTPRQIPIFQALGFPLPRFGHLPMILGSDKTRLSKRHGATSIMAYKEMGYLPEAMVNYLVRLGWSHGDQELFSRDELIEKFSWKNVQTSPAVFNPDKLLWLNAEYLKTNPPQQVAEALVPLLEQTDLKDEVRAVSTEWLAQLVVLVKERTKTLVEMVHWVRPYFGEAVSFDEEAAKKFLTPAQAPILTKLVERFEALPVFSKHEWEEAFKKLVEEAGIKMGQLAQPVRVALTGRTASPGLFEVMEVLGRERTLIRLRKGIEQAARS
ncbi:MAG: glutamate--tRNA ligase [Nitrospira sp.]|nr:glutamate--tRNA ligase [Nitrospira sp.]HMV59027.1 glutamate--tRNA ligase [Nitrospira sp.]HMZ99086.1 glutamate--tRNA ligase [Nitrospira sp.]HNA47583.1 glutamate--tRNA ligase [Nitrospira sp.]HNE33120.1 glutamate--tRNA ligase [Nitrospira sp.]